MKTKGKILVVTTALLTILGIYIYSNSSINGIYKDYIFEKIYPDSNPYLIITRNNMYTVDYDGSNVREIRKMGSKIIEQDGQLYFRSEVNFKLTKISANFMKLNLDYPGFAEGYEKITKRKLPEDHHSRVFSPILQSKIYNAIDAYEKNPNFLDKAKKVIKK